MIDLDKLESSAKKAASGLPGDRFMFMLQTLDPEGMLELIGEVRKLRKALANPLFTGAESRFHGGVVGEPGLNQDVAKCAFYAGAPHVSVFYGEERIYTSLAQFMAETQS